MTVAYKSIMQNSLKQELVNCLQHSNNGNAPRTIDVNSTFTPNTTYRLLPRQILTHTSNNFVHYEISCNFCTTNNTLNQHTECIR